MIHSILAAILLLNLVAGLMRIARGTTAADVMLAAQLFGTTGVGTLLLLSEGTGVAALRDVALGLALLAVLSVIAFVKRGWRTGATKYDPEA